MEKKYVIAAGHGPVPMEENSRRYITDKPVQVPLTTYYRRRLLHGELKIADDPASAPVQAAAQPSSIAKEGK